MEIPILPLGKLSSSWQGCSASCHRSGAEAGFPRFVALSPTLEFLTRETFGPFLFSFVENAPCDCSILGNSLMRCLIGKKVFTIEALSAKVTT